MVKHVLRNALIMVTVLVFMSIPWLISGAVVTENIFGIPGMGNLLLNSIIVQDFPVVQACVLDRDPYGDLQHHQRPRCRHAGSAHPRILKWR